MFLRPARASIGRVPSVPFRILTLLAALSAWALVVVGGLVRVTESGLGCPDWPLCHGDVVPLERQAPLIEYSHRATATVVAVLVVLVAVWVLRSYRRRRDVVVPAVVAAMLVPFQALLGAIVVWLELPPWIVAIHFVVGMLFLATTVVTAARARRRSLGVTQAFLRTVWSGNAVALVLVSLGAAVVAGHADEACGRQWPACNGGFVAGGGSAMLHVAHRSVAYVVAALAVALAALACRGAAPRMAAFVPLVAVAAQIGFGISIVLTEEGTRIRQVFEVLHVAGAAAVWASLVGVAAFLGPPSRRRVPLESVAAPAPAR